MNLQQLRTLVTTGESDRLEFKRSTGERREAAKTVCAMLNGLGGFVLIGVNDSGQIIGQQVTTQTMEDIAQELRRIEPPAFPETEMLTLDSGLTVIVLRVSGGGAVSIAIYDDRLEIGSTGALPFGLTAEDLTRPHESRPWNPLIANAFYRRGIIESWGRGTLKMAELNAEAGLVAPEFEDIAGQVLVRFRPTRYVAPTRIGHDLNPLQRGLLDAFAQTGAMPLRQIREVIGLETPEPTVRDNLKMLRNLGLIDLIGTGRGARWRLKEIQ